MMAAARRNNKHAAILIITLLAFLAPMACHGGALINFPILCSRGWVHPIPFLGRIICPHGSTSGTPILPLPSPSPNDEPAPPSGEGLYLDYYSGSCPNAETIVRRVVEAELASQGPGIGAGLIRLHFHDCFVEGCDASVLLNTTASGNSDTEREGLPNKDSLRGFDVIDQAKAALENDDDDACPGVVSCADILAFAARDAARSLSSGKIDYRVPGGRYDGRDSFANRTGTLPGPFSDLDTLKSMFADQGLNAAHLVLLSGAHSIGLARCRFISSRPGMNQTLANDLRQRQCTSDDTRVNQDYATPDVLDSQYYQNVVDNDALFDSDAALADSTETNTLVQTYKANSMYKWEKDFGEAMVTMGKIKVKTKDDKQGGEIRKQCWTYNKPPYY